MFRVLQPIAFLDGPIVAIARVVLLAAYALAVVGALVRPDAAVGLFAAVLIALVNLYLLGWREFLALLLAPDWPLWHPRAGWGPPRRVAAAIVSHAMVAFIMAMATYTFLPHMTLLVLLPLAGGLLQRMAR